MMQSIYKNYPNKGVSEENYEYIISYWPYTTRRTEKS